MSAVPKGESQRLAREKVSSKPGPSLVSKNPPKKKSSSPGNLSVEVSDSEAEQEHAFAAETDDAEQFSEEDLPFLTGDVYFDVTLSKTHFSGGLVYVPRRVARTLPPGRVVADFVCNGKNWRLFYIGDKNNPRFDRIGFRSFLTDMKLVVDDVCVFQLVECNSDGIIFRVIILKNEVPPELLAVASSRGSPANPIELD